MGVGSVFVFTAVTVQARLLSDLQETLQGILPICARCKKIRVEGGDPRIRVRGRRWKTISPRRPTWGSPMAYAPNVSRSS